MALYNRKGDVTFSFSFIAKLVYCAHSIVPAENNLDRATGKMSYMNINSASESTW